MCVPLYSSLPAHALCLQLLNSHSALSMGSSSSTPLSRKVAMILRNPRVWIQHSNAAFECLTGSQMSTPVTDRRRVSHEAVANSRFRLDRVGGTLGSKKA